MEQIISDPRRRLPIAVVACIGLSMTVWVFLSLAYEESPWAWTVSLDLVLGTVPAIPAAFMAVGAGFAVYVASKIAGRRCYLFALISLLSHLPFPILLYLFVAGPDPLLLVFPVGAGIASFGMASF